MLKSVSVFEDYLKKIHAKEYYGTDDDMPDNYEYWLMHLEADDFIKYGDEALETMKKSVKKC